VRERRVMTAPFQSMTDSAATLRREFDAAFAEPPPGRAERSEALLIVRAAPDWPVALRVAELGGLFPCPPVLRLPGAPRAQLGIVGLRGRLTVALCLAAALGRDPAALPGRWLALWAADRSIGFVFAALDGYVRATPAQLSPAGAGGDAASPAAPELVQLDGAPLPLVSTAALIAKVRGLQESSLYLLDREAMSSTRGNEI
jgi:chemotaxis signal transduction protein